MVILRVVRLVVGDDIVCGLVNVFLMKTCSFGEAEPRSATEGLFCRDEEPRERYEMSPCHITVEVFRRMSSR